MDLKEKMNQILADIGEQLKAHGLVDELRPVEVDEGAGWRVQRGDWSLDLRYWVEDEEAEHPQTTIELSVNDQKSLPVADVDCDYQHAFNYINWSYSVFDDAPTEFDFLKSDENERVGDQVYTFQLLTDETVGMNYMGSLIRAFVNLTREPNMDDAEIDDRLKKMLGEPSQGSIDRVRAAVEPSIENLEKKR